jgi:hypothetical protein
MYDEPPQRVWPGLLQAGMGLFGLLLYVTTACVDGWSRHAAFPFGCMAFLIVVGLWMALGAARANRRWRRQVANK